MENAVDPLSQSILKSQTLRLVAIAGLALVLLIPIAMIGGLVSERRHRRAAAVQEVSSKWGNPQTVVGPALVIPYTHRWTEVSSGTQVEHSQTRHWVFLPERLAARGRIDSQVLRRGIYSIPVYRLSLVIEGEFEPPDLADLDIESGDVIWDKAYLAMGIADARAIQQEVTASWDGNAIGFLPGVGAFNGAEGGIHAPVDPGNDKGRIPFSFPLSLNGTRSFFFAPFGKNTSLEIESNYPSPSFQGNWLPARRSVSDSGFSAAWSIPFLGRNYAQQWSSSESMRDAIVGSTFGVEFSNPVDHYRMAGRSLKYAVLFLLFAFAAVWLMEVLSDVRVHPIQYLMLGAGLCLFFLLELAFSEHLGFPTAYSLAAIAIVFLISAFCQSALKRLSRSAIMAIGVASLYGYLYVLLMNEDYALLIGSAGLFATLAAVMFLTRRLDWYALGRAVSPK